jgi:predicted nucleic acid-binding protein
VKYCLDSWAVVAWLEGDEPAASRVERVMASERPLMSWINLGEVLYVVHRRESQREARGLVRRLRPRLTLDLPNEARVLEAATIKAEHRVAYADAFAVATAVAHEATLLTGDPEILAANPDWPVEDLR